MKKYSLKRSLVALGLVGVISVNAGCSKDRFGYFKDSKEDEVTWSEEEIEDTKVVNTYLANEILVLDSNYLYESQIDKDYIGKIGVPRYKIIDLKREYYDSSLYYDSLLEDNTAVFVSHNLAYEDGIYNSYGTLNLRVKKNKKEFILEAKYLLEGVITLNSFLEKYGLDSFKSREYTKEEIEEIYNYINRVELDNTLRIDNLFLLDMRECQNENIDRKYCLVEMQDLSMFDRDCNRVINEYYNNQIGSIWNGCLVDKGDMVAFTGGIDNPEAVYFFNREKINQDNNFFRVVKVPYQEGFKVSSLESFLRELGLDDLIKEDYTKEEIIEIYDYINSLELYR